MIQKPYDKERTERLTGINGEQAYLLISDHIIGKLWHVNYGINNYPLNWINRCLACNTIKKIQNKCVIMDQGGEIAWNPVIVSLFDKYGYAVIWTAPDAYHQKYPAEGPHRYKRETFRTLMEGNQVTLKLWTYSLSHYIKVHGMVPHGKS